MPAKHVAVGKAHSNERAPIRHLVAQLPDPYVVYSNVELSTGRTGGSYEHDLLIIAPHAVFTVELKAWSGRIAGNRDRWELEDGALVHAPTNLVLKKARILASQLRSAGAHGVFVQGFVYVTGADARLDLDTDFASLVVTRRDVLPALTDPARWDLEGRRLDRAAYRAAERLFSDGAPARWRNRLGDYTLIERLDQPDGAFYEAWRATNLADQHRTLHVYPVRGSTHEVRERERDRARREANLLERLRGGPHLLASFDLARVGEPEEAYLLPFEDTANLMPLAGWVARHDPNLDDRLAVAERLARGLKWLHDRQIVHRRLSPDAVLVSNQRSAAEVRLCALELARDLSESIPTVTSTDLADASTRCMAPEYLRTGEATRRSDRFALGATLFELFNGHPLFDRAEDALRPYTVPALHVGQAPAPDDLTAIVRLLLDPDPVSRPELDDVLDILRQVSQAPPPPVRVTWEPGQHVARVYVLEAHLGDGSTSTNWRVRHTVDGRPFVAKIANAEHADDLGREGDVLRAVTHPHLVRYHSREPVDGGLMLLLDLVDGVDARTWAGAGDPLSADAARALGEGVFGALGALHAAGYVHRDVKPENLLLTVPDARPTLIDLGLACLIGDSHRLTLGSATYKDPALYDVGAWQPRDDLYAAWLTLYELLTGLHPFAGRPSLQDPPRLEADDLPDTLPPAIAARLLDAVRAGLAPDRDARPADAAAAAAAWAAAFELPAEQPARPSAPAEPSSSAVPLAPATGQTPALLLPADLAADTPLDALPLGARAHGALTRLGVTTAGQLPRLSPDDLRDLRNVGRKTLAELRRLITAVGDALGAATVAPARPAAPPPVLYPGLVEDTRPLTDLGDALTGRLRAALRQMGVLTIGALAALPHSTLRKIPSVGDGKITRLREALARLAEDTPRPATLAELDAALRAELGAAYAPLAAVFGLQDGLARGASEAAALLDLSRQRVSQTLDLAPLRAAASHGAVLRAALRDALPRAGFASLDAAARALASALPADGPASALGYARLGAVLLQPDGRATDLASLDVVARPPWTPDDLYALRDALASAARRPALPRAEARELVAEHAARRQRSATLRRWQADDEALLQATLTLCPDLAQTTDEALFTPPVGFADALEARRAALQPGGTLADLRAALDAYFGGVLPPVDLPAELAAVGLALDADRVVPLDRERPAAHVEPVVDVEVAPTPLGADDTLDVAPLLPAVATGGFRVAALPLGRHHALCDTLADALRAALGHEKVRVVDVDRTIVAALRAHDLWTDALHLERRPGADLRWTHAEVVAALDAAIVGEGAARRGAVTVLARPALLGPLGLMEWLGGLYERARGGRLGLLVLALPGGIHDGRVRLNEKYPLPYTPDMAALVVREGADRAR